MIPHGRTETGKLVISRSEISDGMRRINASQDRMLNRRLETIERQERTAEANHKKTVKRAVGDHDQKSHHQQSRGGATVDFPRREADVRPLQTQQRGASIDLAQYDAIRKSRSRGQSLRFRGQQRPPPPQGAETKGNQLMEPSQVGHRWSGLDASVKAEGMESGGGKMLSSSWTAVQLRDAGGRSGRSEVSRSPLTQGSLAVVNGQGSNGTSPSPSRPR